MSLAVTGNDQIEKAIEEWKRKKGAYEIELAHTADPEKKYHLRRLIHECDQEIERLRGSVATTVRQLFGHAVELIDATVFQQPAPPAEVERYYGGAPLNWNIVAADGLVRRDLLATLLEKLGAPTERARMLCIVGEPGGGKSSLARQALHEIVLAGHGPILRLPSGRDDPSVPEVWRTLARFSNKISQHFYVFADDVFRNTFVVEFLKEELDTNLPVTILVTSRSNQYRPQFSFPVERLDLMGPSPMEKRAILHKLGKRWEDLSTAKRVALDKANSFLILMYELTQGRGREGLDEIIRTIIENLETRHPDVYEAYRYICFSGQFDMSMPVSTLGRLVHKWRYEDLLAHPAANGVIFPDPDHSNRLRAQHQVLAASAVRLKGWKPEPLFHKVARATDPNNVEERRYLLYLMLELARNPSRGSQPLLSGIQSVIEALQREATVGEMTVWHTVFRRLGLQAEADRSADAAFSRAPADRNDWHGLIVLSRERLPSPGTFDKIRQWLQDNSHESLLYSIYLDAVRKHSPEQIAIVLDETHAWLAQNSQNFYVREHYLGLVRRKGSKKQVKQALAQTADWLAKQASTLPAKAESQVRTAYLALVRDQGTDEQAAGVLAETRRWPTVNPDDLHVRQAYLVLAKHRAAPKQAARVIDETEAWLANHQHDRTVRPDFLNLVKARGNHDQTARVIKDTQLWLAAHPHEENVRSLYVKLVEHS